MGTVRDPAKLKEMWVSWHKVGQPMKGDYVRMVDIANAGARELGFADTGAMWRAGYDMPADEFAGLTDRLLDPVKPLYLQLPCLTRAKLTPEYGEAVPPAPGPLPPALPRPIWAPAWGTTQNLV